MDQDSRRADDPPATEPLELERRLAVAMGEVRRARAEQKRLELMAIGLSGALREQADVHLETLNRLQRREEEALRRSEERFHLLLESAGEGICGLDAAGEISFVNPAAAHMLGDPPALLDRPLRAVLRHTHEDDALCTGSECPLEAPLRTGVSAAGEATLHREDGRTVPVEYTSTPIREGDTVAGAVIILRDASERRRIEQQRARLLQDLQASIAARDDFLSIASHELRTPLTPVRYQVHMLKRALRPDEPLDLVQVTQRVAGIEKQLARLERLIDQLLDVSRITVGRLDLHRERVDLTLLVQELVARMQSEFAQSGSLVSVDAPTPVIGHWDVLRVEQVVSNLLSNAVKYGGGRPVEVVVRSPPGQAVLQVCDYGIGIAPEDQSRIFDRFERLVSVRHYGGFGLGLWIVRTIVDAHGGTIEVESEAGRGTTFRVTLPTEAPAGAAPPATAGSGTDSAVERS